MRCYLNLAGCTDPADMEAHDTIASAEESFKRWYKAHDRNGYIEYRTALIHLRDERQHDEPKVCEDADWRLSMGPRGGVRRERC